jgi:mRNA interferase MazF
MFEFGSIVLTRFPFTDLSGGKVRPALVVSRDNERRVDVVLAFITSRTLNPPLPDSFAIQPSAVNGLKVPSLIRFDKLATLEKGVVAGQIGRMEASALVAAKPVFFGVFGFAGG